jgi:hypothetical protein
MNLEETIVVHWELKSANPLEVVYAINKRKVGHNDEGFNQVLMHVRENPGAKIKLDGPMINTLGGNSREQSFPFASRWTEFLAALGKRSIDF